MTNAGTAVLEYLLVGTSIYYTLIILKKIEDATYTVRSLISEKSFLLTHCFQIYIRTEISWSGFLDVSR
jgi:hypothetical protein